MRKLNALVAGVAVVGDAPGLAALRWLIRFIEADSVDQPGLFSPKSGFTEFVSGTVLLPSRTARLRPPTTAMDPTKAVEQWKPLHAELKQAFRNALEGHGQQIGMVKLRGDDAATDVLFVYSRGRDKSPDGIRCQSQGSLKTVFVGRVVNLIDRFGELVKLCPACSKIFVAQHRNQAYHTRVCSDRVRQERHWRKTLATQQSHSAVERV